MRRKAFTLLAAVSVLFVAFSGAAAADSQPAELAPENERTGDVGTCVVGVDSPCNGEHAEDVGGEPVETNDSAEENRMWIPEDQNRDGEIDDRFTSENDSDSSNRLNGDDDADGDIQILLPEDQNHDGEIDDRFTGDESEGDGNAVENTHPTPHEKELNDTADEEGKMWIPEDQNHDGEIDDRFTGEISGVLSALLALL